MSDLLCGYEWTATAVVAHGPRCALQVAVLALAPSLDTWEAGAWPHAPPAAVGILGTFRLGFSSHAVVQALKPEPGRGQEGPQVLTGGLVHGRPKGDGCPLGSPMLRPSGEPWGWPWGQRLKPVCHRGKRLSQANKQSRWPESPLCPVELPRCAGR